MAGIRVHSVLIFLLLIVLITGCDPAAESKRWVGPDYFSMPLHDWSVEGETLVARPASFDGRWSKYKSRLYHATKTVGTSGSFTTRFQVRKQIEGRSKSARAGIWLGLKSRTTSPQNVWIHPPDNPLFIGVWADGTMQVGKNMLQHSLNPNFPVRFEVSAIIDPQDEKLSVTAISYNGQQIKQEIKLPPGSLAGSLSLIAMGQQSVWRFDNWTVDGDALVRHPERSLGPILWSQYTLQDNGSLKLQAQMVPLEASDQQEAVLEFKREGKWTPVSRSTLEPMSSTFVFRVDDVAGFEAVPYRVVYLYGEEQHFWDGEIRRNPRRKNNFTLAVFNCDHGELFPQDTMVRNVTLQDPDMLYFAGDQIYEAMDKVQVVTEPLEGARLSYLSKYFQFGLTWRNLLKNRPSVIIPDDHDVFMPNVWGEAGKGYSMDSRWVNMVQRTQTGSLPDPVDPVPVENGIDVYFTALDYAGMSFAVIEDRKFKSHPRMTRGISRDLPNPATLLDVPGALLLGERQLAFLKRWGERTAELPVRWFLSQSMFGKGSTHSGPTLNRLRIDLDSNGWPQSARNRALRAIPRDTIMVNGDQHLGMLSRLGIDTWGDGPLSFMVTGSAVGHPRAWWPDHDAKGGPVNGPYSGNYVDDLGNHLTVLGVTNPEPLPVGVTDAQYRPDYHDRGMFALQNAKGAGHGLVIIDKLKQEARFEAYRLDFKASKPTSTDQFPGFPITIPLR